MKKKELKKLFDKTIKASQKFHNLKRKLDKEIQEKWNTHYSDHDEDVIIDGIDYGFKGITFEQFCNIMKKLSKRQE